MQTPFAVAAADPSSTNIWAIANTPILWICILGVFAVIFVQTVLYAKAAKAAAPHIEMPAREVGPMHRRTDRRRSENTPTTAAPD